MSAPFSAELVALGHADSVDASHHNYDDTAVLLFVAPIAEVRKAGALFGKQVTLHPGLELEAVGAALKAAGISIATDITPEVLVSGINQLAAYRDGARAELAALGLDRWPVLLRFIAAMVKKLDVNKPKKGGREGWRHDDARDLVKRVLEEAVELQTAVLDGRPDQTLDEAADVANMAMMVVDACGVLP